MKFAKRLALTAAALAAVTAGTLSGASADQAAAVSQPVRGGVDVPDALKVPDGNRLTGVFAATGVQTYTCTDGAWKLLEPAATLSVKGERHHRPVALHSRGPVWVSTVDGSAVNAAAVATSPRTGTIPELLLKSTATRGAGCLRRRLLHPAPRHRRRSGPHHRLHRHRPGKRPLLRRLHLLQAHRVTEARRVTGGLRPRTVFF